MYTGYLPTHTHTYMIQQYACKLKYPKENGMKWVTKTDFV